jgi:hypothetical protein
MKTYAPKNDEVAACCCLLLPAAAEMVLDCLAPGPKDFPYIAQDGGLICISGFWKIVPNIYGFKGKLLHLQVTNTTH